MINIKSAIPTIAFFAFLATAEANLRGDRSVEAIDQFRIAAHATRTLKAGLDADGNIVDGGAKTSKTTKNGNQESDPQQSASPTAMPSSLTTDLPTETSSNQPTSQPVLPPNPIPPVSETDFDSTITVFCKPDGMTTLTQEEARAKTIMCDATQEPCREAVLAVRKSTDLQNYFACAGNLGEGASRKLFNRYARNAALAKQLALVAEEGVVLVTERSDEMKAACMSIGMDQTTPVANPCCQGSSGCASTAASSSSAAAAAATAGPLPFMTVAITACTGDNACKDMGPNPLILDSSCTGVSACELMNHNDADPTVWGITFVGEMSCTTTRSCEGVGHRSYGDVAIHSNACLGPDACNAAGRRRDQGTAAFRSQSHVHIGSKACVGSDACKDTHSTVNRGPAGKHAGSLTVGEAACTNDRACEKLGFNDGMKTDIIVAAGECTGVASCRGCMTKSACSHDEVYIISNADGACPKGGSDSNNNPTGDKVDEYCIEKDTLPTEGPTFYPTPFPTLESSAPTSGPTNLPSQSPSSPPSAVPSSSLSRPPSGMPSDSPSSLPSDMPSLLPSDLPSAQPSDTPSNLPSDSPSSLPSDWPSLLPSDLPSAQPSAIPSNLPSDGPSSLPSDMPSLLPSDLPSHQPSDLPSTVPSSMPSSLPSALPSSMPSDIPSLPPSQSPSQVPSDAPSQAPTGLPGLQVGCLATPGDVTSTFNVITGEVFCDNGAGPCATFVSTINGLSSSNGNMIKSIFGCNGGAAPGTVTLDVAQKRFDTIKNDASAMGALVEAALQNIQLFTGSASAVTTACDTRCCTTASSCSLSPSSGVMTVSAGSCTGLNACKQLFPDTIIITSCTGNNSCSFFGGFSEILPNPNVEIGYRVVGPEACANAGACTSIGLNMFGNVRVEKGACDGDSGCARVASRPTQGTTLSPTVGNVFIGAYACQGRSACQKVHFGGMGSPGSLTIEKGACLGLRACIVIASVMDAVNDLVIRSGVCDLSKQEKCNTGCLIEDMCGGDFSLTYVIDNAAQDCPGPNPSACVALP